MNELPMLILMFLAGAVLGVGYFAGLWFTVRRIHSQERPAIWLAMSFFVRMGLLIAAFYWLLGDARWDHLLAALAGFLILRSLTIRHIRRNMPLSNSKQETPA
ncbi:MAG: ATP synthase subunit I [Gammaproteobacteria bacterium]|jgi:F1F0 ATPase subunit 2